MVDYRKAYQSATAQAQAHRKDLVEALTRDDILIAPTFSAHDIAWKAHMIANADGEARVFHLMMKAEERELPASQIKVTLLQLLSQHPNDDYSGRNNDVRRSFQDGIRHAINAVLIDGDL